MFVRGVDDDLEQIADGHGAVAPGTYHAVDAGSVPFGAADDLAGQVAERVNYHFEAAADLGRKLLPADSGLQRHEPRHPLLLNVFVDGAGQLVRIGLCLLYTSDAADDLL